MILCIVTMVLCIAVIWCAIMGESLQIVLT